jgi:hypothetical protein
LRGLGFAVLALVSLGGCGSSSHTPSTDGSTKDGSPNLGDGGMVGDGSPGDGSPAGDGGISANACDPANIVDLNMRGTRTGNTTDYHGSTLNVPFDGKVQTCRQGGVYPLVLRYLPYTSGPLIVSLANAGTASSFATVAWSLDQCKAMGATELACDANEYVSAALPFTSVLRIESATANVPIYIVVGGNVHPYAQNSWHVNGSFEITVSEAPVVIATGDACDPAGIANICTANSLCLIPPSQSSPICIANGSAYGLCDASITCKAGLVCIYGTGELSGNCTPTVGLGASCSLSIPCAAPNTCPYGVCKAPGSVQEAPCSQTGNPCGPGLTCVYGASVADDTAFCIASADAIAIGQACNLDSGVNCVVGSHCAGNVCAPNGTAAGTFCATTSPACTGALVCNGSPDFRLCSSVVGAGASCDGEASICAAGTTCTGMGGNSYVCVTNGTMNGSCRQTTPACDAGLGCGELNQCVPALALGATCDVHQQANICGSGASCIPSGSGATCVADGATGTGCSKTTAPSCPMGDVCGASSSLLTLTCQVAQ